MDEQLRAQPDDVVALLRAGRLSPKRVAMAAYLGDPRALATGVEPWVPPEQIPRWSGPAQQLLRYGGLAQRERVWLCLVCVEHVALGLWMSGPELEMLIRVARDWCRGKATTEAVEIERHRAETLQLDSSIPAERANQAVWLATDCSTGAGNSNNAALSLATAVGAIASAAGPALAERKKWEAIPNSEWQRRELLMEEFLQKRHDAEQASGEAEQAWQAHAIASTLLDPDWPPWEE